nr:hypothetical protein [Tanacetum cinerariifolium]
DSTPLEAKDHVEIVINFNDDISSSDDDSLLEENIEYVEASPHDSELVSLEATEIVIPEVEEIEDDNLCEKLLNVNLLIANIEALKDNPTQSSEFLTKSSSTSFNSLLEETSTFHNFLPKFENFYFDLGEISSGSTNAHSDISLPDYEALYFDDDHIKEISSGSTTTHSDISLSEYDSFIFEEFVDELAHIISPPEYDCFYFRDLPDQGELMSVLNSGIRENLSSATSVNLPIEDDHSPLLTYVSSVESLVPILSESEGIPDNMCDVPFHDNSLPLYVSKDQFEDFSDSNDDSTSIDDDSFSIDNIEYVEASPPNSELVSSEVMEIVIPEVEGIDDDILLTIKDDILHEKLLNVNLLIANIETLNDNPTPSSDFMTKSSSTFLDSLLEETSTFDNSLPELETFCFDLEEISSGSTSTRSDISLPYYEAFYDDHVKEISSGSTINHSDCSLYDSFIFDLSINPFPPTDMSDFYELPDELTHIVSPPEYDCFCFKNEPNSGDFTMDVVEDIFPTRELVHNALPTHPPFQLNLDFILSSESLFAYVVWIFLPFLSYLVAP